MDNTWNSPEYRSPWDNYVANTTVDERVLFIRRTYAHLFGAILAFAGICYGLIHSGLAEQFVAMMARSQWGWVIFMGLFVVVSLVAGAMASSATSAAMQYAGLGIYVVLEAFIISPLLLFADLKFPGQNLIPQAATVTLLLFGGLSAIVVMTKKDFSFLRSALMLAGIGMFVFAIGGIFFHYTLGWVFCVFGVTLACGYILYDTSNVLHHYRTTQHVAAALALFASVAMLFYYVLRLMMELSNRRD